MKFINPQNVVSQMGLKTGQTVADLGSGSGFFSLAAARMVGNTGKVYAVDVQKSKLMATFSSATQQGLSPITFAALSNPDQGGVYSRDITIPANAAIGKPFKFDCMGEYWNSTTSHYEQKHGYSSVNIVSGTPPPTTGACATGDSTMTTIMSTIAYRIARSLT